MNAHTLVASILGLGLAAAPAASQTVASAHADVLAKDTKSWNGNAYTGYPKGTPELTVLKMTIPANTALPWHTHPFPNAAYVVSGQLTVEDKTSGQRRTFRAGEAFTESVNDVHRGVTGKEPVVLIITYSGSPGVATFTPEAGEKAEY